MRPATAPMATGTARYTCRTAAALIVTAAPDGPVRFHYPAKGVGEDFGVRA